MARERIAKTGMAPGGRPVWTARELALLAVMFPDYKRAVAVLERRSFSAVKQQAQAMGLTSNRHRWTGAEISRLRKLFPTADNETLQSAFPGIDLGKIKAMARYVGIRRQRRPFKVTGIQPIDQIRDRAFKLNISMVELDAMARTKYYFQKAEWHAGIINYRAIGRATKALNGLLAVRWKE